ncbi:MAG: response regulator [Bacteroidales bacterium]|nr:response regulator [Bacteroidales bacterium]MCF8336553.1 response regulator [Bacteroidales bacterium]
MKNNTINNIVEMSKIETGIVTSDRQETNLNNCRMDIKMPDINGYEATRRIKEINPKVPIIAQTAYALEGDRQKTLDAGCDEYVSKPVKKEQLLQVIQNVVGS